MSNLEARLVDLEIRYTHQERLIQELNDVLVDQSRALERLAAEVVSLRARPESLGDGEEPGDEPPPHY